MKRVLATCVAVLAMSGQAGAQSSGVNATVISVTDGDTIVVETSEGDTSVRLIGIDTPETYGGEECYGPESSAYTRSLLPPGTQVRLELDVERYDRYGRLLAYVYTGTGVFVNKQLVRNGFAIPYRYPPNVRHAWLFDRVSMKAQARSLGLWSHCR